MRISLTIFAALGLGIAISGIASASPKSYQLPDETAAFRPGPGVEVTRNNCAACHSADYVSTQPPHKGQAFWEAEVRKMIKVYGAPIDKADIKPIAEYLAKTY